jgi:hypothetical protein
MYGDVRQVYRSPRLKSVPSVCTDSVYKYVVLCSVILLEVKAENMRFHFQLFVYKFSPKFENS